MSKQLIYFYKLKEDTNGAEIGSGYRLPEGFTAYNPDDKPQELIDAEFAMLSNKEQIRVTVENVTKLIEETINRELVAYNTLNGVAFDNVHSCESYSRKEGYPHKDWCGSVWSWSVDLWTNMRLWQSGLNGIPTMDEVKEEIARTPFLDTVIVKEVEDEEV